MYTPDQIAELLRKCEYWEELARLLQRGGYIYAEEQLIPHSTVQDLNKVKFQEFYEQFYKERFEVEMLSQHIANLRLGAEGKLNLAGALLFGKNLQRLCPQFFVTAIWFYGNDITDNAYRSSENMYGTLDELYRKSFDFVMAKLNKTQPKDKDFNSLGNPEIPEVTLSELLVNALIHRDYFINDSIKLYLFENRVEIISPGCLPNNLTEEQVKRGIRRTRNSIISSFAPNLMNYRGAGSGLLRALAAYPHFELHNETDNERVLVRIARPLLRASPTR